MVDYQIEFYFVFDSNDFKEKKDVFKVCAKLGVVKLPIL